MQAPSFLSDQNFFTQSHIFLDLVTLAWRLQLNTRVKFFDGYYESFGKMNIETILPRQSLLNRRRKKWVYPKQTSYFVKKLSTSDFGTLIAGA